jgi:hypothetical protein
MASSNITMDFMYRACKAALHFLALGFSYSNDTTHNNLELINPFTLLPADLYYYLLSVINCPVTIVMLAQTSKTWKQYIVKYATTMPKSFSIRLRYSDIGEKGYLGILKCIGVSYYGYGHYYSALESAAQNGHLHILKWAIEKGYSWSYSRCVLGAVHGGYLEIVKYLISNMTYHGMIARRDDMDDINCNICSIAAFNGQLHILKWARERNYAWTKDVCHAAALNDHSEVLVWARQNGCKWDSDTENLAKKKWPDIFS